MKVLGQIARGGFGRVERVELADGSVVVRKTYDPREGDLRKPKFRDRFIQEARTQQSLDPTFVMPVLQRNEDPDEPWFIMPEATKSLSQELPAMRASNKTLADALTDILEALEYLHALDYVHRDLKPANILCHEGRWKLSDFGLVLPPSSETSALTSQGSVWGTYSYMSPEQATNFHLVDPRADIYSLGCILHDVVDGRARLAHVQQQCTGSFQDVVARATAVDPLKRYQSVAELRPDAMAALQAPLTAYASPDVSSWVESIGNGLDAQQLRDFVVFLQDEANAEDCRDILREVTSQHLEQMHNLDPMVWGHVAQRYCRYVRDSGFEFSFCDVLIGRVQTIFSLGRPMLKAQAILAAAELAASHNRWFVMRRVLEMASGALDEGVARRLVSDVAGSANPQRHKSNLQACVTKTRHSAALYHPAIADLLAT